MVNGVLVLSRLWKPLLPGGDDGNRTHDPLLAGQVLSQLSYTPIFSFIGYAFELVLKLWSLRRKVFYSF